MATMPPRNGPPRGMAGPARPNVGLQPRPVQSGPMPHNMGRQGDQNALQQVIKLQTQKKMMGR